MRARKLRDGPATLFDTPFARVVSTCYFPTLPVWESRTFRFNGMIINPRYISGKAVFLISAGRDARENSWANKHGETIERGGADAQHE
jgi:hypothetical protein